jgi:hypothetical protein
MGTRRHFFHVPGCICTFTYLKEKLHMSGAGLMQFFPVNIHDVKLGMEMILEICRFHQNYNLSSMTDNSTDEWLYSKSAVITCPLICTAPYKPMDKCTGFIALQGTSQAITQKPSNYRTVSSEYTPKIYRRLDGFSPAHRYFIKISDRFFIRFLSWTIRLVLVLS